MAIRLNGEVVDPGPLPPDTLLVHVLQKRLGVGDIRRRCTNSRCGGCTILFDGEPVQSCAITWEEAQGHDVQLLGDQEDKHAG